MNDCITRSTLLVEQKCLADSERKNVRGLCQRHREEGKREKDSVSVEFLYTYCYIHSWQFAQLSSEETHHWHRHQPSTHAMELIGNEKWVHAVNGINLRSKTVDGEENVVHEYAKSEDLIEVLRRVYEFIVSAASPNVFTICLRFSFFFRVYFIRWS